MGVKGLWALLEPSAKPVRLEALSQKRLAVDASIWLYQMLKAMSDSEGQPLEYGHVLGFYRRISKLLYYDIMPVFVFDGKAPELKRNTIAERQAGRVSKSRDARRAAQQLLKARMKLHLLGKLSDCSEFTAESQSEETDLNLLKKRKRDEYELLPIDSTKLEIRDETTDLRMANTEDLHRLLHLVSKSDTSFDDIEIDIDSPAFKALSPEDQHDLIVTLKVRSRQTSHDRLKQMLDTSETALDFSKHQIDNLLKRNNLTQQWLHVTGASHRVSELLPNATASSGRIVSARNREYLLVKSDRPGEGWTLKVGGSAQDTDSIDTADQSANLAKKEIVIDNSSSNDDDTDDDSDFISVVNTEINTNYPRCGFPNGLQLEQSEDSPEKRLDGIDNGESNSQSRSSNGFREGSMNEIQNSDSGDRIPFDEASSYKNSIDYRNNGISYDDDIIGRPPFASSGTPTSNNENSAIGSYSAMPSANGSIGVGAEDGEEITRDYQSSGLIYNGAEEINAKYHSSNSTGADDNDSNSIAIYSADATSVDYENIDENEEYSYVSDNSSDGGLLSSLYKDCERLEALRKAQEEEAQARREQEEQALLELPPDEFLNTWAQLVTPSILELDPNIHEAMRYWLLGEDFDSLRKRAWHITRRLEKQPDLDVDEDQLAAISDPNVRDYHVFSQLKIARLSFIANYLNFVLRWRDNWPQKQANNLHSDTGNAPSSGFADQQGHQSQKTQSNHRESAELNPLHRILSISDEVSDADEEFANPDNENSISNHKEADDAVDWFEQEPETSQIHDNDESSHNHDLIFAKAKILSALEDDFADVDARSHSSSASSTMPSRPNVVNIDSDSDDELSGHADSTLIGTTANFDDLISPGDNGTSAQDIGDSESEDEEAKATKHHIDMMKQEHDEYALFVEKLKAAGNAGGGSNAMQQMEMRAEIESELQELRSKVREKRQAATGVDNEVVEDVRMLLTLFGIPYITAPMEAEAQCAVLAEAQLVDGVVTDDSDAFLFSSCVDLQVYRHFFQKDKYVERYNLADITTDSSLSRRDFVFLTYLVGSDYTVGIKGIGPVTAMEILAEFGPGIDEGDDRGSEEEQIIQALRDFKSWHDRIASIPIGAQIPDELVPNGPRRRLVQVAYKCTIPDEFPDPRVAHAYFNPQVDSETSEFEWGLPNLDLLRQFLEDKLGWGREKSDQTLIPLIRAIMENKAKRSSPDHQAKRRGAQTTLDSIVSREKRTTPDPGINSPVRSKRVIRAISARKDKTKAESGNNNAPKPFRRNLF